MVQSLANVLVHIIFCTKQRQPMITPEVCDPIFATL